MRGGLHLLFITVDDMYFVLNLVWNPIYSTLQMFLHY